MSDNNKKNSNQGDEITEKTGLETEAEQTHADAPLNESNVSETSADGSNVSETSADESNASETSADESNASETSTDKSNASETSADESNASETSADAEDTAALQAAETVSPPKKAGKQIFAFMNMRKFKYGTYATVITLVVLTALVLVNVAVTALESNFGLRADLTSAGRFTLSEQTIEVLKSIDTDIEIILMTQNPNSIDSNLQELVSRYQTRNKHISFRTEDPVTNPGFARQFSGTLSSGSVVVTNSEYTKYKILSSYDFYSYNSEGYAQYFTGEQTLTSAIVYVDSDITPKVYFLTGHDETPLANASYLETYLARDNYDVSEINLIVGGQKLEPGDALVVLSPKRDISDDEREILKEFVLSGGKMFYAYDVGVDELPNFESILKLYNVGFESGVVIEDTSDTNKWYMSPAAVLPTIDTHEITETMISNRMYMLVPAARAVKMPDSPKSGVTVTSLLSTSPASFIMNDLNDTTLTKADTDPSGPFTLAAAIEERNYEDDTKSTRIVVVGNSEFLTQAYYVQLSSNIDFFLSGIKWISPQKVNVSIYGKSLLSQALNIQSTGEALVLMGIVLLALPLLVLICGGFVWMRRRHL